MADTPPTSDAEQQVEDASETTGGEPSAASKLADAREKEELKGKEAFLRGDYDEAIKAWTASLRSVRYLLEKKLYAHNEQHQKEVENMDIRFNINLAQAYNRKREFTKAIEHADNALARDPKCKKALYRKSVALMETLNFLEATRHLQLILDEEPDNKAAQALLQQAKRSEARGELRARKIAQRIFGGGTSNKDDGALKPLRTLYAKLRHLCCKSRGDKTD
ncbi:Peptidyl-prolyl cis-trans isomerase FKBP5 [Symbiodinium microadriaticum]|uniref:Peptidyl-prolyl cis-trans isomerase FKBP5 n=1 Tax=Symbiodinium microadriaticum TaxID=2951 RepID=A0A1Q9C538_SYMMI|nr:Peptidyl-prolyl cis-trans isomerase FKBP5 [Symbiodinium microadriaticum]